MLSIYLLNTYCIPGHILGAGVRTVNKVGKRLDTRVIGNMHLI